MPALPQPRIAELLEPFVTGETVPDSLYAKLSLYLDLLIRWNGRTNLTAIRDPAEIVQRHFGASVFTAIAIRRLNITPASLPTSLLDFGSGAGFPGLPIQLVLPMLTVTLAESQGKKAAFLREAVRVLGLNSKLWAKRVEDLPPATTFDAIAMRAVDSMPEAIIEAHRRLSPTGTLLVLGGEALAAEYPAAEILPVPESSHRFLIISRQTT